MATRDDRSTLCPPPTAMTDPEIDTLWLHDRVGRFRAGDRAAADELLRAVGRRLERLARRMLRDFPGVRAGADTSDVVQGALIRLVNALRDVRPGSTREFTGLAALQVRRELLDLGRHFAARGAAARVPDPGTADFGTSGGDQPADLELWSRFHAAVDGLPADEREAFGLLFYHGYTRPQAALLLGVAEQSAPGTAGLPEQCRMVPHLQTPHNPARGAEGDSSRG